MGEEHPVYFYEITIGRLMSQKLAQEIIKVILENFPEAECYVTEHKINMAE